MVTAQEFLKGNPQPSIFGIRPSYPLLKDDKIYQKVVEDIEEKVDKAWM